MHIANHISRTQVKISVDDLELLSPKITYKNVSTQINVIIVGGMLYLTIEMLIVFLKPSLSMLSL